MRACTHEQTRETGVCVCVCVGGDGNKTEQREHRQAGASRQAQTTHRLDCRLRRVRGGAVAARLGSLGARLQTVHQAETQRGIHGDDDEHKQQLVDDTEQQGQHSSCPRRRRCSHTERKSFPRSLA
jgi:hypothetical protein